MQPASNRDGVGSTPVAVRACVRACVLLPMPMPSSTFTWLRRVWGWFTGPSFSHAFCRYTSCQSTVVVDVVVVVVETVVVVVVATHVEAPSSSLHFPSVLQTTVPEDDWERSRYLQVSHRP